MRGIMKLIFCMASLDVPETHIVVGANLQDMSR
jgi:hypothetical protein